MCGSPGTGRSGRLRRMKSSILSRGADTCGGPGGEAGTLPAAPHEVIGSKAGLRTKKRALARAASDRVGVSRGLVRELHIDSRGAAVTAVLEVVGHLLPLGEVGDASALQRRDV